MQSLLNRSLMQGLAQSSGVTECLFSTMAHSAILRPVAANDCTRTFNICKKSLSLLKHRSDVQQQHLSDILSKRHFSSRGIFSIKKNGSFISAPPSIVQPINIIKNGSPVSRFHTDEDRTTATILNKQEGAPLMVDSFSEIGFRLNNGLAVMGSMALFPTSVLSWSITDSKDITEESLSLFVMLAPKIDLLVLGLGDRNSKFDMRLLPFLRDKGIALEMMATEKAVATFNFLNGENRCIAGAFIPPKTVSYLADDYADAITRKREMFQAIKEDDDW